MVVGSNRAANKSKTKKQFDHTKAYAQHVTCVN